MVADEDMIEIHYNSMMPPEKKMKKGGIFIMSGRSESLPDINLCCGQDKLGCLFRASVLFVF